MFSLIWWVFFACCFCAKQCPASSLIVPFLNSTLYPLQTSNYSIFLFFLYRFRTILYAVFQSFKNPTQNPHLYFHFEAPVRFPPPNDIQDDTDLFSSFPSRRFHSIWFTFQLTCTSTACFHHRCTSKLLGVQRGGRNAALARTKFSVKYNINKFMMLFNSMSVPSPHHLTTKIISWAV